MKNDRTNVHKATCVIAMLLGWLGTGTVWAQEDARIQQLTEKIASLEQALTTVDALQQEVAKLRTELTQLRAAGSAIPQADAGDSVDAPAPKDARRASFPGRAQEFQDQKTAPTLGGQYTKPFLTRLGRSTYLGGYIDVVFKNQEQHDQFIDQQRLVPFIYSDISELFKFSTEIEIEHGGPNSPDGGELAVEFATLDMTFSEAVNFRGGIVLSPLGKINLVHDSPLQDLTERPIVDRFVIPTTLSEPGFGFFGSVYPGEEDRIDYEVYLVDGFDGLRSSGATSISRKDGLRKARGGEAVINNQLSTVARVAYSPFLGLEVGASTHEGRYDEDHNNWLSIRAIDFQWQWGAFELLGEAAYADIDRDAFARARGIPDDFWGATLQANYHFLPKFLHEALPKVFRDESTFTLVGRWDHADLDDRVSSRATIGLNFRYTEDTVLKFDYQINNGWGEHAEKADDDDAFLFSMASYF